MDYAMGSGADVLCRAPSVALGSGFRVEAGASFEVPSEAVTCPSRTPRGPAPAA